jgi:hypothetical protein
LRKGQRAFHPASRQRVQDLASHLFIVIRDTESGERVYGVFNVTSVTQTLALQRLVPKNEDHQYRDLISEASYGEEDDMVLQPYQCLWLVAEAT